MSLYMKFSSSTCTGVSKQTERKSIWLPSWERWHIPPQITFESMIFQTSKTVGICDRYVPYKFTHETFSRTMIYIHPSTTSIPFISMAGSESREKIFENQAPVPPSCTPALVPHLSPASLSSRAWKRWKSCLELGLPKEVGGCRIWEHWDNGGNPVTKTEVLQGNCIGIYGNAQWFFCWIWFCFFFFKFWLLDLIRQYVYPDIRKWISRILISMDTIYLQVSKSSWSLWCLFSQKQTKHHHLPRCN